MSTDGRILLAREFNTDKGELSALPGMLERVRKDCPISDDQFYSLVIALTEAVANAITHGNKKDATKLIRYSVECLPDGIRCMVEDEGEGFEADSVADPLNAENLLRDGGRGIFLIRSLMLELNIINTGKGTRIEFLCPRK